MPKPLAKLPGRPGLDRLGKTTRSIQDYAKVSPDALREPLPIASTILSVIAGQRRP